MMTTRILSDGNLRLELNPAIGGSISAFEWAGAGGAQPIMRDCPAPFERVLDACSFPLVPYVNRIRGGAFVFRGREVRLAPNMAGDPSPLHGQGWLNSWAVERHDRTEAVLLFEHRLGEWPWAYEARQEFHLDPGGLSLRLTCRNTDDSPMPCGLGQHPYFPCTESTRIDTAVATAWTVDKYVLPVDEVPAEGRYQLSDRPICGQDLDNGFGGWGGEAMLTDPGWPFGLRLSSPQARYFQIYSPASGGFFVAEPVTHANAALNAPESDWPGFGIRVLEPGESMSLDMRIDVTPIATQAG